MGVILWSFSMILHKIHQNPPEYRLVIALKQIFQLESIPCIHSNHVFNCLFGNVCLDSLHICGLSPFFLWSFSMILHKISSSYSIETNIPIGKHTLHSFKSRFQLFVWKCLLGCYIYAVYHHFLHFQPLLRINTCERNVLDYCHAHI